MRMRSPDLVGRVEGGNPTLITASPAQSWCDRPIESCWVSRYLLIHKQRLDSTQPNLQREEIALVPAPRRLRLQQAAKPHRSGKLRH